MKKLFLSLPLLSFILFARAQPPKYGLSLGANFTDLKGNGIKDSYKSGLLAGGFARITLNKKWELQPEILVNTENSTRASNFLNYYNVNGYAGANSDIKLTYITVPLLLGYNLSKLLTLNAGPQYSLLVYDNENLIIADKAVAFKRNDVGVVAGAQLRLDAVNFFGRYTVGLSNVNNIDSRYKWHDRQIQVGMNVSIL